MAREAPSRQKTEEIKKQPSGEKETTFTRCSMNCSKAQGGTIHPSFFKIMLGNYEKTLAMPLKFRRVCGNLLGRIAQLQDSDGRSWAVEVSEVADRLAFRGGWDKFVSDHSIVFGEFLVFGYSGDLSFSVRIFGRSGCERRNFRQSEPERRSGSKRRASELFLVSHGDSGGNVSKSAASCSSEPEIADGGDRDCVNSSCEISSKEDDDVKKKKKQEMGANLSSNSSGQVGNKASAPNVHLDELSSAMARMK
ncbi:B3 domain-containing protein Os11g0197600-like isoform X2 [Wolffia australiana]